MRRVVVVGAPGSGKSTVGTRLAKALDAELIELDSLWWDKGWQAVGKESLRDRLTPLLARDRWVVEGAYVDQVSDLVWPVADIVLWLDLPRRVSVSRAVLRSLARAVHRQELYNGNRESLAVLAPWSIWGLVRRSPAYGERIEGRLKELGLYDSRVERLRSQREVDMWCRAFRDC